MGKFLYTFFILAYKAGFRIAALFNNKAKAGFAGRKDLFARIDQALQTTTTEQTGAAPRRIWMHCASLGEFEQGRPVLETLREQFPTYSIVLTFFSASGFETMKSYTGADHIFYLPFDGKANAKKLVEAINPSLVLWVKYEYWYYYLHELKRKNISLLLLSGIFREGQPFFKWYGSIWKDMLGCFTHFFLQNEESATLLRSAGAYNNITVTGDTRFDRVIDIAQKFEPIPLIEKFCGTHKVVVAGSTWEDDEAELTHYVKAHPEIKFIIAPHEIDAENLKDVKKEFINSIFYSEWAEQQSNTVEEVNITKDETVPNVLIIDNVGMLSRLYRYATITYVGGGFGAEGVHNVLEAAVYGKPVIYGPEFDKFAEAIELTETGAGISIENALELERVIDELWQDESLLKTKGEAARKYVYAHKGASSKIIQFIQEKRLLTN
ncbi:MAG: glycosyltransferase N-terminal domain-containing protein [Ferruginibacter sp.]